MNNIVWNLQVLHCQMPNCSMAANWWVLNVGLHGWVSDAVSVPKNRSKSVSVCQTNCAQQSNTQRWCCATSLWVNSYILVFGGLSCLQVTFIWKRVLQVCFCKSVHASKCVHLTHQGVCPIWSVLANLFLLCLHGKRSKANIETWVMACFALWPNCLSTGLLWGP